MLVLALAAGLPALARAQSTGLVPAFTGDQDPNLALGRLGAGSATERARMLQDRNTELLGAGAVDPETYILGPGDVLGLELIGAFSLSAEAVIAADGTVTFPQFGTFPLSGITLAQARERITGRGKQVVRGGDLQLTLRSTRAFKVFVVGRVIEPGSIRAGATTRVSEAITLAGGPAPDAALRGIDVIHTDASRDRADLLGFLFAGLVDGNPTVRDGDVILVSPRADSIEVMGAVANPGAFAYVPGDELGAVLRVVGMLPDADPDGVSLQRVDAGGNGLQWSVLDVDLEGVLSGASPVPLQPRDRILVRGRGGWGMEAPAVVTGAVAFPGPIPVQRNTVRVRDLVNRAGGPLEGAVLARILLTRRVAADTVQVGDPSGTRRFVQNLTSRGILESTVDLTQGDGPYVEPGDVIQVPRVGGFVQVLGQVRRPGTYDYREGWRPRDYVDEAGGYAQQADTRQTRVTQGQQGTVVFANDIETLAPGDMIWVPEKPPGSFWQVLRDATFLITSAATLYLLVREATR